MKPITKENRELIIAAKGRGEDPKTIAIWFDVAVSSVYNILALHKETGDVTPKPYKGKPCRLNEDDLEKIRAKIKEQNDITLEELIDELDLPIKKSRLSEIVIEMDLPLKKDAPCERAIARRCARKTKKAQKTSRKFRRFKVEIYRPK